MPHQPDPHRHGASPAFTHRGGSVHAPMWAMECLDCGTRLRWHRMFSQALAELTYHQEMHRVWRAELRIPKQLRTEPARVA